MLTSDTAMKSRRAAGGCAGDLEADRRAPGEPVDRRGLHLAIIGEGLDRRGRLHASRGEAAPTGGDDTTVLNEAVVAVERVDHGVARDQPSCVTVDGAARVKVND